MAIVRQISLQSDAFFKAMESHEELHVCMVLVIFHFDYNATISFIQ